MDPQSLLLKHHGWKQHLIPILAVRTLHEHTQLQEGLGDLVPAVQLLIHSCCVAEGRAWNWEYRKLPLSHSSLSLPSCKAACKAGHPTRGTRWEKATGHFPSSSLSLVTVGLGLPGKEDTQTNHHLLNLLKKKTDLNWSNSQIIRMC